MKAQFTYWKESDGRYLGYLNDYPDHWTQGESMEDLKEHLKDLFHTFTSEQLPGIDQWTKDVKAGKLPDFGANLIY